MASPVYDVSPLTAAKALFLPGAVIPDNRDMAHLSVLYCYWTTCSLGAETVAT